MLPDFFKSHLLSDSEIPIYDIMAKIDDAKVGVSSKVLHIVSHGHFLINIDDGIGMEAEDHKNS